MDKVDSLKEECLEDPSSPGADILKALSLEQPNQPNVDLQQINTNCL